MGLISFPTSSGKFCCWCSVDRVDTCTSVSSRGALWRSSTFSTQTAYRSFAAGSTVYSTKLERERWQSRYSTSDPFCEGRVNRWRVGDLHPSNGEASLIITIDCLRISGRRKLTFVGSFFFSLKIVLKERIARNRYRFKCFVNKVRIRSFIMRSLILS